MAASEIDERLDQLYREPPDGFVAGRNALAKELRAAGDREAADEVKALRKPSAAAWAINRAALESPQALEDYAAAGAALADAQARALEGDERATEEWRGAAAREREATGAAAEAAERAAAEAGHPLAARALELVVETLRAAAGDPELRDRVLRGRVERERSAATLGMDGLAPPRSTSKRSARRREDAAARRELRELERELEAASEREERLRGRVAETEEALRREREKLGEAQREVAAARRKLKAAKG